MFEREFTCPSCGAPVKQKHAGSRTLFCNHCGQTSHLNANTLQAAGEQHLLIDYGSVLAIGQTGNIRGREFMVLGKIRIDYEDGFWDEWYIQYMDDGSEGWIQEDDGSFTLFQKEKRISDTLLLEDMTVGEWNDFCGNWEPVFITSKSQATINGGEGELPFRIIPGEPADFVDGVWNGKIISVELLPDEKVLFSGKIFSLEEMAL